MTVRSIPWRRLVAGALIIALVALATSCSDARQSSLDPASDTARKIDFLFDFSFAIAAVIFVVVFGLLGYILYRFRERPGGGEPRQTHGNTRLELTWTVIPALILAVLAIPTVGLIFDLSDEPEDALAITVKGHQWWWEVQYPGEDVEVANEIHIPVGRPVVLTLETADVIHSFWVPRLSGKQDLVPGHTNTWTIEADEAGTYWGQCAEYCGTSHANMRLRVMAQEEDEFQAWLDQQRRPAADPSEGLAAQGAEVFQTAGCVGCHAVRGTDAQADVGPDLTHVGSRTTIAGGTFDNTPENLAMWLRNPPEAKPGAKMPNLNLSEEQIDALVAYLQFLK